MDSRIREFLGETRHDAPFGTIRGAPVKGRGTTKTFSSLARSRLQLTLHSFCPMEIFYGVEPREGMVRTVKFDDRG